MPKTTCKHKVFPELGCRLCELEGEVEALKKKLAERDKIWCKAALVLDTRDLQKLMETFNRFRDEERVKQP